MEFVYGLLNIILWTWIGYSIGHYSGFKKGHFRGFVEGCKHTAEFFLPVIEEFKAFIEHEAKKNL